MSIRQLARKYDVSTTTIQRTLKCDPEMSQKVTQKKEENTADILAHMETKKGLVCQIMDVYLEELLNVKQFEKLTPNQLTTALGTLIDKFAAMGGAGPNGEKEDGLSRSLRELGEGLESDDK